MLTSQNNDLRWILATIAESENRRFWGWHELFFVTFFWLLFFLRTWNQNFFFAFARENTPVQPLHMLVILETPPSPSDDALCQKRHFLNSRKTYHSCISYDHMSIPHTSLPTTSPPKKCTSPSHFSTQQPPCQNNTDNQNPLPLPISMPSRRKDR
jgi:hypothetical protein